MDIQPQGTNEMRKLADLIGESQIAMLTTAEPNGLLHSRPLVTLQIDTEGRLWFFISVTSPKI